MRNKKAKLLSFSSLSALIVFFLAAGCRQAGRRTYEFQASGLKVEVDGTGAVSGVQFTGLALLRPVRAFTRLPGWQLVWVDFWLRLRVL